MIPGHVVFSQPIFCFFVLWSLENIWKTVCCWLNQGQVNTKTVQLFSTSLRPISQAVVFENMQFTIRSIATYV